MDQVGAIWASFLEALTNDKFEDALNEFMRLSNACSRIADAAEKQVASEIQKEGELKFNKTVSETIQNLTKQSITKARNGDLSTSDRDVFESLRLLGIRVGVGMVSVSPSTNVITSECRQHIKQMMVTHLTVRCSLKRDELKSRLDLKKRAKNIVSTADDGFLDAIEAVVNNVATLCKTCFDWENALSESQNSTNDTLGNISEDKFFSLLIRSLHEVGASQLKQIIAAFWEDRRLKSFWFVRANELGGLTLPRALSSSNATDHHTPSRPPSTEKKTPPPSPIRPLDDNESLTLDLVLHESSQILSLCDELQPGLLDEIVLELVSAMVRLDELWLTHSITKAVSHAVSLEIEPPICVNSIVEDIFHVSGTCFARAVNSRSLFAAEATANHVAGFLNDGFCDILHELVRKDSPNRQGQGRQQADNKASRAVANLGSNNDQQKMFTSDTFSPAYVEAINTVASATVFCDDLKEEMLSSFGLTFNHKHAMAPQLLEEARDRMQRLLEDSMSSLVKLFVSAKALKVMNDALDPRAQPYELGVAQFERENIVKATWVNDYVDNQFRGNVFFRECLPTLSHSPAALALQQFVKICCDIFEEKLSRLRFTALGALQFEKDLRLLSDTIVQECNLLSALNGDEGRWFDSEVRTQFRRLRHWAFLLNLERASDEKEIEFPAPALTENEIKLILKKRTEQDFYH